MQERHRAGLRHGGRRRDWARTPRRRSSPAGWPRSCGWESRWAPSRPRWPGLAGVGDLVATCTSPQSRNRSFGERLGKGGTHGGGASGGGRSRRRRRHIVRVGAGAGVELRRRDAADRRGAPGVPQGTCRSTRRSRCCWAAAPSRSSDMDGQYGDSTRSVKAVGSEAVPGHRWHRRRFRLLHITSRRARTTRWTATGVHPIPLGANWNRRWPSSRAPRRH